MATVIVELDQFDASITVPDDGDTASAASIAAAGVGFQPLANRTNYLHNRLLPAGGIRVHPSLAELASTGTFAWSTVWKDGTGTGASIQWTCDLGPSLSGLPGLWTVDAVTIWTINVTGHGGSAPSGTDRQRIRIYRKNPTEGTSYVSVADAFDPSAAATLDTLHSFGPTSIGYQIRDGDRFTLSYEGEDGANAQPDTEIHDVYIDLVPA